MNRIDLLIEKVRRYTATQSYTDAAALGSQIGLQTQMIVDLFNEAHQALHGTVFANAPQLYIKTNTQDVTSGTESYSLPSDAFLGANIVSVEYKYGSGSGDYRKLQKRDPHQRDTSSSGNPYYYIQHEGSILLNPVPNASVTNGLRITYEYILPTVDIRRGKVTAVDDGSNPTSITISGGGDDQMWIALGASAAPDKITVVDSDGVIQMNDITVSSYNSGTGVLTVSASPEATEAVAVNDYVVIGHNTSSHSPFPDFCENYLTYYVIHAIMELLGHPGADRAAYKLAEFSNQVADVFSDYNTDIMQIPDHDADRIIDFDVS